ncbi:MAG: hypothetical protein GY799_10490 [Desulfobulbaceae bacterium]|nr:hypothetical protein [Desulfobulbaceae bacterium]
MWLKPDRLAQLGLTANDVSNAIQQQNQAFGVGQIGRAPSTPGVQQSFVVTTKGMLTDPAEFDEIILRAESDGSAIVRIKDVGHAELGSMDYSMTTKLNGKKSAAVVVYQQPGANAIATSKSVRALIEELEPGFPDGLKFKYVIDTSKFTEASIEKVVHTFFETVVLVVLVSVFLPVAFWGGLTGTLYKQFAITIAISMVISGIVALTLSPALAARILKPGSHEKKGFGKWFDNGFIRITNIYLVGVRFLINHKLIGLCLFGGVVFGVISLFKILPGSFVPAEDQGYVRSTTNGDMIRPR